MLEDKLKNTNDDFISAGDDFFTNGSQTLQHPWKRKCPRGTIVKTMECGIVVRELEFQSLYCIYIRTNTFGKGMNPLILPDMG